jgi:hypothetical protein
MLSLQQRPISTLGADGNSIPDIPAHHLISGRRSCVKIVQCICRQPPEDFPTRHGGDVPR